MRAFTTGSSQISYRSLSVAFSKYCFQNAHRARCYSSRTLDRNSVIFSGIQPTGIPHLGNYLGALRPWVQLQEQAPASTKLIYCIVDLHALTGTPSRDELKQWKKETLASLLAIGLDPGRCTIYFQSDVWAEHAARRSSTDDFTGTRTQCDDVDFELQGVYGLPIENDPMEGTASSRKRRTLMAYATPLCKS